MSGHSSELVGSKLLNGMNNAKFWSICIDSSAVKKQIFMQYTIQHFIFVIITFSVLKATSYAMKFSILTQFSLFGCIQIRHLHCNDNTIKYVLVCL